MKIKSFEYYENTLEKLNIYLQNKKHKSETLTKNIGALKETLLDQEFKIAVVANMSAGKSTFINTLFGDDVLPAFTEATTDCATYIYSDNNKENNKAVIYFEKDKNCKPTTIKASDVKSEIKKYAKKDSDELSNTYKQVEKINLDWDFKYINTDTNSRIKVTFIDTPGPNNTGEFSNKHKLHTANLINEVDLVLFLFDYTQLDATLESDEQGIWNKLKNRKQADDDFGVYFIINKIDASIDDLITHTKELEQEDRQRQRQEKWNIYKEKAIDKISKAANAHGFYDPSVYTVASNWTLWQRKDRDEDEDDDLDNAQRKIKRVWNDEYEDKFHQLLGFDKLESEINHFIQHQIEHKILKRIHENIEKIILEEEESFQRQKQVSSQSEEEAKSNLRNAKKILDENYPKIYHIFEKKVNIKKKELQENIENIIEKSNEKFLSEKVEQITLKSLVFVDFIARGKPIQNAKKQAKKYTKGQTLGKHKIEKGTDKSDETIYKEMILFLNSLTVDFRLDYSSEIKQELKKLYEDAYKYFNAEYIQSKEELNKIIDDKLEVHLPSIEKNLFDISIDFKPLKLELDESIVHEEKEEGFLAKIGHYLPNFMGGSKLEKKFTKKYLKFDSEFLNEKLKSNIEEQMIVITAKETTVQKEKLESINDSYKYLFSDFKYTKESELTELETNYAAYKDTSVQLDESIGILNKMKDDLNEERE